MTWLFQLDGSLPNLALMKLAARHPGAQLRRAGNAAALEPRLGEPVPQEIYASLIFERSRPLAERLLELYPGAVVGGTGWDYAARLPAEVEALAPDYSIYPGFRSSIGFTQRGCRLKCPFCVVPKKEGAVRAESTVTDLWRGEPWPRELVLLDNDFFGEPGWRERIAEIRDGAFKVSFSQGINARFLTAETAEAVASVDYRANNMRTRRIYTAWDSRKDERRLFRGLELLREAGVKPDHIMVYMLVGYWPGETHEDREHRRRRLREFGARPYPMAYAPTRELRGYQRWVIGAYDKTIPWERWTSARYAPQNLGNPAQMDLY